MNVSGCEMALPLLSMGRGDHGMGGHSDECEPSNKNIYMSTQYTLMHGATQSQMYETDLRGVLKHTMWENSEALDFGHVEHVLCPG